MIIKVVKYLEKLGVVIEEVSLLYFKYGVVVYYIVVLLEVFLNL